MKKNHLVGLSSVMLISSTLFGSVTAAAPTAVRPLDSALVSRLKTVDDIVASGDHLKNQ